jgi:spore maturation protein CgeB
MKNYRIVRINGLYYQDIIQSFLDQNPDYSNNSYDDQLRKLFQTSPMLSDALTQSFRNLGQEAFELVFDFEVLQKQWAKENGIQYSMDNWKFDIMLSQISVWKPDVIYFQGTELARPGIFASKHKSSNLPEILKNNFPFLRLIVMFSGYPCGEERVKGVDILFAGSPSLVTLYRKMGMDPNLLYHSFDESIINKLNIHDKQFEFTFAGSSRAPESRYWALKQLMEETNLEMWLSEDKQDYKKPTRSSYCKGMIKSFVMNSLSVLNTDTLYKCSDSKYLRQRWRSVIAEKIFDTHFAEGLSSRKVQMRSLPIQSMKEYYPDRCHAPVMGMDMYNILYQSKVTFNKHADAARGGVGNIRLFEATGVGTCLLTDKGNNMVDLFEEDREVVTYASVDEAVEKVKYLLGNREVAEEIAKAGQNRTLKDHTVKARCRLIDDLIQANL